jgi:hypothetical protein
MFRKSNRTCIIMHGFYYFNEKEKNKIIGSKDVHLNLNLKGIRKLSFCFGSLKAKR